MTWTDRGLREVGQGLQQARVLIVRKKAELQSKMGLIEAELSALGKIEAALDTAIDVMRQEQMKRETAE